MPHFDPLLDDNGELIKHAIFSKLHYRELNAYLAALIAQQEQKKKSNKQSLVFWQHLSETLSQYYYQKIYPNKPWYEKLFIWLGWYFLSSPEEKQFFNYLDTANAKAHNYSEEDQSLWDDSWVLDYVMPNVTDQKSYTNTSAPQFNFTNKLKVIAHRLMGKDKFDDVSVVQGNAPELETYKVLRELEKFRDRFKWDQKQRSQLDRLIKSMQTTLSIMKLIVVHQTLTEYQKEYHKEDQRIEDIIWVIGNRLKELAPDDVLVVPHGYNFENSGHAALVEFNKANNRINFINTGAGAADPILNTAKSTLDKKAEEQIIQFAVNGKLMMCYLEPEEPIDDKAITDDLIDQIISPSTRKYSSAEEATKAMSAPLHSYAARKQLKSMSNAYNAQTNGTCSHSCWEAWLSLNMDNQMFHAFQLFVNHRAQQKLTKIKQEFPGLSAQHKDAINRLAASGKTAHALVKNELQQSMGKNTTNQYSLFNAASAAKPQSTAATDAYSQIIQSCG